MHRPVRRRRFVNNRVQQPNSAAFQFDIDDDENFLYVINQRIDQTSSNTSSAGNVLHTLRVQSDGSLSVVGSRHLGDDGVSADSRPHGVVSLDLR